MKIMKTFEEYRYFGFGSHDQDCDEPFFIGPKKRYKEERKRLRAEQQKLEDDERYRQYIMAKKQKADAEFAKIAECTDILKNRHDLISKFGYKKNDKSVYIQYGILLKNGDQLITYYRNGIKFHKLMINDIFMENIKPEMYNREVDPLGEETWNDNEKSNVEILGDLIRDYVRKNEIIF